MGVRIGKDCIIYDTYFDPVAPNLIEIGNRVAISGGTVILAHDAAPLAFIGKERFAPVKILDDCFIGHRTIIQPGVTIGPESVVGTGSVVTKDVPPRTVAAGVPAKVICSLDEYLKKVQEKPGGAMVSSHWVSREDYDPHEYVKMRDAWLERAQQEAERIRKEFE